MRKEGRTDAEIAALLEQVEAENREKVEDWVLDEIIGHLRLAAQPPKSH
jgi:hypothetical protein